MKKLDHFEFPDGRRGRHDWETWLDGNIYKLTKGKDFTISCTNMRNIVYSAAHRRGLKIRISIVDNESSLVIQAYKDLRAKLDKKES